ncbi:MAG: DsbA family protein [Kangiellaceae bacterium]|nr:DsbA family protein [Kangiellaceae bacterium]
MNLARIILLSLLITACNPTEEKSIETTASKPIAVEEHNHKHENTAAIMEDSGLPYDIIESDEACESPIVIEFFAYQCPHCSTLEKFAKKWKDKNAGKVEFRAVPTHLGNQQFGSFLIVHQAAKVLGVLDKATPKLFSRIHDDQKAFASEQEAVDFLIALGVSKEDAVKTLQDQENSKNAIDDDFRLLAKYKIAGVPTILVNHRYQFDVTKAGGYEKVFEVVDQTLALPSNCGAK